MGATLSEPCIYDKLSESIDILRQSGYRYGMSEREIEKFIRQVLETNEPRREPPQLPVPLATVKFILAIGFLLLAVLAFVYPPNQPGMGWVNSGSHNWSHFLSHVRLLSLPIAQKYNLQGYQEWPSARDLANCSVCAEVSFVMEAPKSLRHFSDLQRGAQPVLVKGAECLLLQRQHLEQLYSAHFSSVRLQHEWPTGRLARKDGFPQGPANFTLHWEEVLAWLFPRIERCPLLATTGSMLRRCQVTHTSRSQSRGVPMQDWLLVAEGQPTVWVLPVRHCRDQCHPFNLWLGAGDLVYADSQYWQIEMFPGKGQNIFCDGTTF
ncbi:bombesin receptor-activated protein C6orf89 homolog isoform X2 [Denticeps clupeoides]|uniref:bombesin receptor-activated protein C6orf89 homolog isoform X2 n=1 Tax=Denticeps clupeoides TaxID=299321 RepID=UPI0010A43D83|nr:bombesin receptor-activated protein C6orf89 homolog isoform X2 [Denticeps clupeoides]